MTSATPGLPPELDPRGPQRGPARSGAPGRRVRWPRAIAGVAAVAVLATSGAAWAGLNKFDNNITRIGGILTGDDNQEPPAPDEAQNILLVGSDSRDGDGNSAFQAGKGDTQVAGQRSDTMLLVHLAPGNAKATVISFPRDLYVTIPAYTNAQGKVYEASEQRINVAFERGGPALTIQTIEQLTGATIDHYVQVDFAGFQRIVDSVGGVEVCLNKKISDKYSGFKGVAGTQTLNGAQALAFVRQRHGLPAGDLDRIKRQQAFLAATLKQVQSAGTLLNPLTLNSLLDAVTQSVAVDDALTVSDMKDLALKLRGIGAGQVGFLTAPVAKDTRINGQSVLLPDMAELAVIFKALEADDAATLEALTNPDESPAPAVADALVPPGEVTVKVLNAAGVTGLARKAADSLAALGFAVSGSPGNAPVSGQAASEVRYPASLDKQAKTLAAAIPGSTLVPDETVTVVTLYVGSDFAEASVTAPTSSGGGAASGAAASPSAPAATVPKTADQITCVN
jgi:LCP family protein required for cell wall assembly